MEEIQEKLSAKIAQLCGVDAASVTAETNLEQDLGMKSATLVVLIAYLEDEFDLDIDFMKFRRMKTVEQAVRFIAELCDA